MYQPGKVEKVDNPARGQLNRENDYAFPRTCLTTWSHEPGSAVPSRVSLFILHTQTESGAYSRDSSLFLRRRPFIYLNRHTPSGQSRVNRVTQLRVDGVHCRRESAGPGRASNSPRGSSSSGCCNFAGHYRPIIVRLSFPIPAIGMKWAC